jgi:outer membrane lipoprotein carrier protein
MRTSRIYPGFLFLGMLCSLAWGQSDPKAEKVVKTSQERFNSLGDITSDFTYTLTSPELKKPVVKKGTVTLKKGKYRIIFPDEEMYCNGKYTWVLMKSDAEILKSDFNEKEDLGPDRLYKLYAKSMKSAYGGEVAGAHLVTLFANSDDGDIWKTALWIGAASKLIQKAVMYARNGAQHQYEMSNIRVNTGVPDAVFTVDEQAYLDQDWILTNQSEH